MWRLWNGGGIPETMTAHQKHTIRLTGRAFIVNLRGFTEIHLKTGSFKMKWLITTKCFWEATPSTRPPLIFVKRSSLSPLLWSMPTTSWWTLPINRELLTFQANTSIFPNVHEYKCRQRAGGRRRFESQVYPVSNWRSQYSCSVQRVHVCSFPNSRVLRDGGSKEFSAWLLLLLYISVLCLTAGANWDNPFGQRGKLWSRRTVWWGYYEIRMFH